MRGIIDGRYQPEIHQRVEDTHTRELVDNFADPGEETNLSQGDLNP